jgi:hypothetical protein
MIRSSLSVEWREFLSAWAWVIWIVSPAAVAINLLFLARYIGLLPKDAMTMWVSYSTLVWPICATVPLVIQVVLLPRRSLNEGERAEG